MDETINQKTTVMVDDDWPLYMYGFPFEMCDAYNQRHCGRSCGVVCLLFCYKFKKEPSKIHTPYGDVTDKIYKYMMEAVTEGNSTYSMYFEQTLKILDANDVIMMTNHLGVSVEFELEFESEHVDTVAEYVMTLKDSQFLLLFFPPPTNRVYGIYFCDSHTVQMIDSGYHQITYGRGNDATLGGYLLYTPYRFNCVVNMIQQACALKVPFQTSDVWKIVIVQVNN